MHDSLSKKWFNSGVSVGSVLASVPIVCSVPLLVIGGILYTISHDSRGMVISPEAAKYAWNFLVWPLLFTIINAIFVSANYSALDKDKIKP